MRDLTRPGKLLVLLFSLFLSARLAAHEYWIEPQDYRLAPGGRLVAQLKVGEHFRGDAQFYLPASFQRFQITIGNGVSEVKSRIGDLPALDQRVVGEGLALVSLVSNFFSLEYREEDQFEQFLLYEGLSQILDQHRRRGLPVTGFKELYQRFAKSLVQVGDVLGEDRLLGLGFEWLIETNPYQMADNSVQARLFWRGEPLAGVQARLFLRRAGRIDESILVTDSEGRVRFSAPWGSEVLLNAVQMREPSEHFPASSDAAWISYWASVTFMLPVR